jgi:RimJ/RimL family protein N-acetyltransferase
MKLITQRLILRKPRLNDAKEIQEGMNNINVSKWILVISHPYSNKDAKKYIKEHIKRTKKKNNSKYSFFIELKSEKKIIGGIGIRNIDKFQGIASIGYWISERYWGQGYGKEAVKSLINFAFKKLNLRRIEAEILIKNKASINLLKKLGFKKEGLKRKSRKSKADNKIYDMYFFGLLKENYKN